MEKYDFEIQRKKLFSGRSLDKEDILKIENSLKELEGYEKSLHHNLGNKTIYRVFGNEKMNLNGLVDTLYNLKYNVRILIGGLK